eukprot:jgi/Orpsp1_1/1181161/evm.model.c7180000076137.1
MIFYSYAPLDNGFKCLISNCTFTNFTQTGEKNSAILNWQEDGNTTIKNCKIENVKGVSSYLVYSNTKGNIELFNVNITNYESTYGKVAFSLGYNVSLKIQDSYFSNINFNGMFFQTTEGQIVVNNLNMVNVNNNQIADSFKIFEHNHKGKIIINNSNFNNITGDYGFRQGFGSQITIYNAKFNFCYFDNSIFYINRETSNRYGTIYITDSEFNNNKSNDGSVFNIIDISSDILSSLEVNNSTFRNNYAYGYGGVIYSISELTSRKAKFINCTFINNTSYNEGEVCYSLDNSCEPKFNNKDDIIKSCGIKSFAINPTKISLDDDSSSSLDIISGQIISEPII